MRHDVHQEVGRIKRIWMNELEALSYNARRERKWNVPRACQARAPSMAENNV